MAQVLYAGWWQLHLLHRWTLLIQMACLAS
jgi:hypothetical protein